MMFYVRELLSASLAGLLSSPRGCKAQLEFNELQSFIFRGTHPRLGLGDGVCVSFGVYVQKDHSLFHL